MKLFLALLLLVVFTASARATTWYVRNGGGTTTQCTGTTDANYPGSGTGQPCAYSNFQDAITASAFGDTINLNPGDTFVGTFNLTNKGVGASFITVQSTNIASIPSGVRVSPSSLSAMPKVVSPSFLGTPALRMMADSNHWKIQGIAVTTQNVYPNSTRTPFLIANDDNTGAITFNHWPHDITIDRCLVYASEQDPLPARSAEEAIVIDGANITITNNYMYNFMGYEYPSVFQTITAATNANPVQVTLSSGGCGNTSTGKNLFWLDGGTGSWAALNGLKVITCTDGTHGTLQNYDPVTWALTNIDSTGFGSFTGQSIHQNTQSLSTARGVLIQVGPGPYTIDNNFIEGQYGAIFLGGAGGTWLNPQNDVTVTAVTDKTHVTLSSIGTLQVGDLISFYTFDDQPISTATAGNPTILTVQQHNFPAGTPLMPEGCITVSGFTGAWAAVNGDWGGHGNGCGQGISDALVVDSTHISITVNSTGFGPVTGSGMSYYITTKGSTVRPGTNPPHGQALVGKVTAISGNNITYTWWGHQPENVGGNGAGIQVTNGSRATFDGTVIHDVTVTHNTLSNNSDWYRLFRDVANTGDNVLSVGKGFWEAKMGNNVDVEGNIFVLRGPNLYPKSGTGSLSLNQANQSGALPWISLNNWTIRNNLFQNCGFTPYSLVEEYETGQVSSGLTIDNNLFTLTSEGAIKLEGTAGVTITHNTFRNVGGGSIGDNWFLYIIGVNGVSQTFRNNIGNFCNYGYDDQSATWRPGAGGSAVVNHNYLIDNFSVSFTPETGDIKIPNDAAMQFVNAASADAGGDYHGYKLQVTSPGHNAASDGKDVGVDFAQLDAALNGTTAIPTINRTKGIIKITGKATIH